ncbi:MAG TPA: hypothetical protein VKB52_16035 [Rhodanobacteraceae bacterium]|nr:hypothetical protein [Rhodanobacteraceae bacterium]
MSFRVGDSIEKNAGRRGLTIADSRREIVRLVIATILVAASHVCGAGCIGYVITDQSDPAHPREIARGTKIYSPSDLQVDARGTGKSDFFSKSLELARGFRIGASVTREPVIDGFGLWGTLDDGSFSWEWFDRSQGSVFKKLQENGRVSVTFRDVRGLQEPASITFESDVSLRINETNQVGKVTYRILVKKDSVLEFPP